LQHGRYAKRPDRIVEAMDRCWLERRFDDLNAYLASDVLFVAPNGSELRGAAGAIQSYREFLDRCTVEAYETTDWEASLHGGEAVVRYTWRMRWASGGSAQAATGQETLLLSKRPDGWRVASRTQTPSEV
jgi:ketosteroid isomerase-like protein